jgi:N-acetylmuramoyl-L-alanine amidase
MTAKRRESILGAARRARRMHSRAISAGPAQLAACAASLAMAAILGIAAINAAQAQSRGLIGTRAAALDLPAQHVLGDGKQAIATAAHLDDSGEKARLTFELSTPVNASAFALTAPDRIVVDMPETDFRVDPAAGNHALPRGGVRAPQHVGALVASFRFGSFSPGRSRIVIDLAAPARVAHVGSEKSADGSKTLLVVELVKIEQAQFRKAAQISTEVIARAQPPAEKQLLTPSAGRPALPVVAIDAGHGGVDCGATTNGLTEKTLVFDFAKTLQAKLEATGRVKIVMTRDSDVFVPLAERVRIAREADAQLFVSIHADTLVDAAGVSGATFYTVSDRASDAEAARTAEKENQADAAAGLDRQEDASGVSDILFDLTRRETRAYSHVFQRTLVNYWKVAGRLNKNPERSAGFRVLKAPDVPSVLIELGYLSSEKDTISFASTDWREKTTQKITEAIVAFFAARRSEQGMETGPAEPEPARAAAVDPTAPADVATGVKLRDRAVDAGARPH